MPAGTQIISIIQPRVSGTSGAGFSVVVKPGAQLSPLTGLCNGLTLKGLIRRRFLRRLG